MPKLGEPRRLPPLDVIQHRLTNGLQVALVERRELPIVALHIVVNAGAEFDLPVNAGRASMTAELLDEGTPTRSALDIAEEIDYLGAELHIQAGWDSTVISLDVMSNRLEPALDVLADLLVNASFPSQEFERKSKERLSHLLLERDEPPALASKALSAGVFGSAHPYGAPVSGTRASIERLSRDDAHAFYKDKYRPCNAFVVAVGDVSASALFHALETRIANWCDAAAPVAGVPQLPKQAHRRVLLVDKPGAAQSELRIGQPGPDRATPDFFTLKVLNTVLGGSFTSRLNSILRERMGVTYGARSSFRQKRAGGVFTVASAIETEAIARSAQVVIDELRRLREEPVEQGELQRAQSYVALGLPRHFESTSDIAAHLREQLLYHLPMDYWATYVDRILAVTAEDVMSAAARHLHPESAVIAVVADRVRVQGTLSDANLGEVVLTEVPT